MSELIGTTLGQYQITSVLGEGGMATVYRAYQVSIKRDVAIKVIESKLARNPEFVKRFEREAQTVASLDHPHILKVFDFGQQGDLIYLVMELKSGGTLIQQTAQNLLPLDRVATLLTQIASALDYAHGRGIIHRDLKPQNVLLDEQGNAFLTDFGIAKLIQPDYTSLTQTGAAMGTPAYMSPEQWQGHALDARSDLYALGIMLYEMLTGQVPFRADTPASMMFAHLQQNPPPLRELRPTLPPYLDPVIEKALTKSPDARFQTARALADAFRDAVNGKPLTTPEKVLPLPPTVIASPPTAPTARRGISLPLLIAGALIAILVIGGLVLASQRNDGSTPTSSNAIASTTAAAQVAAVGSNTPEPTFEADGNRGTFIAAVTETSDAITAQASHSVTASVSPSTVSTNTATVSPSPSPTITASFTPSQTPTATVTLDIVQIVASLDAQATAGVRASNIAATSTAIMGQTLTATLWTQTPTATLTPTPNITASIDAFLTQRAVLTGTAQAHLNETATATLATHTPTVTSTPTRTFTPTPIPTVTHNEQWVPQIVTFDDVDMLLVPPGCFTMGSDSAEDDERPAHTVCITRSFYIDRFEVTNEQFNRYGGEASNPSAWTESTRPRDNITWDEANAYCQRRGGRLPTEAEWEYAARGPDNLIYPWGNNFIAGYIVYEANARNQTSDVGISYRPNGRSWVGAYDMSGNVWEWVADYYGPYPATTQTDPMNSTKNITRMLRGGSWANNYVYDLRGTSRYNAAPNSHFSFRGVRCAQSNDLP